MLFGLIYDRMKGKMKKKEKSIASPPLAVAQSTSWEPQKLNFRHQAIMDLMIANPWMKKAEIASLLEITPQAVYDVTNSELFELAFSEYKKTHSQKISDLAAEATMEALEFQRGIVKGKVAGPNGGEVLVNDIQLRQISARDILNLGHGKAIDKSLNLNASGTLEEALALINEKKKRDASPPNTSANEST